MKSLLFASLILVTKLCFAVYRIEPYVSACGGSPISGGTKSVSASIGQAAIGNINQSQQRGEIGFWHTGASFMPTAPTIVVERTSTEVRVHFQNLGRGTYRLYGGDQIASIDFDHPLAVTNSASYLVDPLGFENAQRAYVVKHSNP